MIAVREYGTECKARHVQALVRMDQGNSLPTCTSCWL